MISFSDALWPAVLVMAAALCLASRRLASPRVRGPVAGVLLACAMGVWLAKAGVPRLPVVQQIAWVCSCVCFGWSLVSTVISNRGTSPVSAARGFAGEVLRDAALLFGSVAAILLVFLLTLRGIHAVVDVVQGSATSPLVGADVGKYGAWTGLALFASCGIGAWTVRRPALVTCQLWAGVLVGLWLSLREPVFRVMSSGRIERSATTLWIMAVVAAAALAGGAAAHWIEHRRRWRAAMTGGETPPSESHAGGSARYGGGVGRGLRLSVGLLGAATVVLVSYHLAAPIPLESGGFRLAGVIAMVSAWSAGIGCLLIAHLGWSASIGEVGLGLATLGVCCISTLFLPERPSALTERYPVVFTGLVVGFSTSAALWTWLVGVWLQQLDDGAAWTTAGRMIPHAKRFAFVSAALALVVAAILAAWPRLPWVSTTDDSLGRLIAGVAANLLMLLVLLWSGRRLRRPTFGIMALLATFSIGSFVILRLLPFTAWFG